jgi:hypothetical protein
VQWPEMLHFVQPHRPRGRLRGPGRKALRDEASRQKAHVHAPVINGGS